MPRHTNRLAGESSPYLLQHAHNPVDWYPWSEEALEQARRQDKPILLSIGYSACHWCHVMEHESFENEEIAGLMNRHFINIKVDREERPDVDAIYMNFVQMTTGAGGWPLTAFLTPDLVPFYGGTYFPPDDHYGRPGFRRLLRTLADAWANRRQQLLKNRREIVERLEQAADWGMEARSLSEEIAEEATAGLRQQYDNRYGGFGGAPKFPAAMTLSFLLRHYRRSRVESSLEMVTQSLEEMARGGIYDQLGGGFHRYSVDERWLVPHFEKMLYDNALLARACLEAFQLTGNQTFREVVEETLAFVSREMLDPEGGFYSALDADSEGEEGKFYVWSRREVEEVLGSEEARIFSDYFDVTETGNFEGSNILNHRLDLEKFARSLDQSAEQLKQRLDACRKRLLEARAARVRPGLDDKVLAAWNGLMLGAFAEAAFVLDEDRFLETAVRNAAFLADHMVSGGRLQRSWKKGRASLNGYLEDYAQVIEGWLLTHQASGDARWLREAARLMDRQFELFWDEEKGNFFFTASDHEKLLVRQKEFMDNATPSGNSVSCLNLLRLSVLLGRRDYRERAEGMLSQMAAPMSRHPAAFACWLQAFDFHQGPVAEIAVTGPGGDLMAPLRRRFLPNKVVARAGGTDTPAIPLLEGKDPGEAAFYLCRDFVCSEPATTPDQVERLLAEF